MQGARKRQGSRLLLGWALVCGIAAAVFVGASVPEMVAGAAGIASRTLRLILKVAGVVVALPVAFYIVEKFFLDRSTRGGG
jgi:hypothetical protein